MRVTLRLTLDVTYEIDATENSVDEEIEGLRDNLLDLPTRVARLGMLTRHCASTVVCVNPSMEPL